MNLTYSAALLFPDGQGWREKLVLWQKEKALARLHLAEAPERKLNR
jgi:hypothetical protein